MDLDAKVVEQYRLIECLTGLWVLEIYVEPSIVGSTNVAAESIGIESG